MYARSRCGWPGEASGHLHFRLPLVTGWQKSRPLWIVMGELRSWNHEHVLRAEFRR
jgi:hypothetical protein